jgi:hypothetical protein
MSGPIVFISHFRVREGKLDSLRRSVPEATKLLEAGKPRTSVFLAYLDQDGTRATFVHAFADAESMDLHFEGAEARAKASYELIEPDGWEIYGRPSRAALEAMRAAATSAGVSLTVQPEHAGGFMRTA